MEAKDQPKDVSWLAEAQRRPDSVPRVKLGELVLLSLRAIRNYAAAVLTNSHAPREFGGVVR